MAESRKFPAQWIGVYKASTNRYDHSKHPIRVGGSARYHSYMGFSTEIKNAIKESKTTPRIYLNMFVLDTGEFDVGLHKESSNKGSGSMPYYRYAGIHPILSSSGSRRVIELTNLSGALDVYENINTFEEALDKGYKGITLYGGSDYASAIGATRDSDEVYLEIVGSWNDPPGKPEIVYPNGGETISGSATVSWKAATDPESPSSDLRYQVAVLSGKWHYLSLTSKGRTSQTIDFDQFPDTSVARIGVRAYDGQAYSPWAFGDGVYTISKNLPPTSPTGLTPRGGEKLDKTEIIQLRWNHNDEDSQSAFDLRWKLQGSPTWNNVTRYTRGETYYIPRNTLPNGNIEWQVRTYDQLQEVSPWSSTAIFYAANKSNRPNIYIPLQGEDVITQNPVIRWSSVYQAAYQLEVWNGGVKVWEVTNSSPNKALTIQYDLTNNSDYQIRLRIKNTDGLWSDYDEIDIHTSFTTPKAAELVPTVDQERGSINIEIVNPEGNKVVDGVEIDTPVVEYNNIHRREAGTEEFLLIAKNVPANFEYTDYTPASGKAYEYMVTSYGDNGSFEDSEPVQANVVFFHAQISIASNPDYWVQLKYNNDRSFSFNLDKSDLTFNGRVNPVSEFSVHEEKSGSIQAVLRSLEEVEQLQEIIAAKETLIYRDARGRRDFVTVDGVSVADQGLNIYKVDFRITKVFYREAI